MVTGQAQRDRVAVTSAPGTGASRPHADELDVLRPAASLLVIITHAMQMFAPASSVFYGAILLESQASRHVFFFVSALVLTYQAYRRPRWSSGRFWERRFTSVVVPYVIWTLSYVLLSFTGLRGDTIPSMTGTPLHMLAVVGVQMVTGPGHLYFVVVLLQFYLLFPPLLWVLNRASRWHAALVGLSLAVQVALTIALHYQHADSVIWQDVDSTREVTSYGFYLVVGAVTGAHLPAVRSWMWRHRRAVLATAVTVVAGAEVYYVLTIRSGVGPDGASDPFSPEFIASYAATIALLWLAGAYWAARARQGRPARMVRSASDNSFGVYLSHIVFLDLLSTLGLGRLEPGVPWAVVVLIAVLVSWVGATLLTVAAARTAVSCWLVGRARRPLRGGPPPVGRGTVLRSSSVRRGTVLRPSSVGRGTNFPPLADRATASWPAPHTGTTPETDRQVAMSCDSSEHPR